MMLRLAAGRLFPPVAVAAAALRLLPATTPAEALPVVADGILRVLSLSKSDISFYFARQILRRVLFPRCLRDRRRRRDGWSIDL